jgi:predicted signal transduction protein with EAL and GGDEF domain
MPFSKEIQQLAENLPELVLAVRRDGILLAHFGGRQVARLVPITGAQGRALDDIWPVAVATSLNQLCRKAIASRIRVETAFSMDGVQYEAHGTATAPDRATCIIRSVQAPDETDAAHGLQHPESVVYLDRRRFVPQLHDAIASAALRETPAGMIVIELAGLSEISEIDQALAERVMHRLLMRLRESSFSVRTASTDIGPISEFHLGLVVESDDRKLIEGLLAEVQQNLQQPVRLNQDTWQISCYAGVALLGRDSNAPKELSDQARIAAGEARRSGALRPQFFSDTMKLKAVARVDVARELVDSVRLREIGMRYLGRYELSSGRLEALVGYVTWHHPLRGEVAPKEFLKVAEASGTAVALSREMLRLFRSDVVRAVSQAESAACFSYGPLRHHLLHDGFIRDIEEFLEQSSLSPQRLEIRVAERSFVAMPPGVFEELRRIGVRAVVDEVGRSTGSLAKMAASPIWGLQLDRALVEELQSNSVALRLCRAAIGAAAALGLSSIATGVDCELTRELLLASGCRYGCGDLFESRGLSINLPQPGAVTFCRAAGSNL